MALNLPWQEIRRAYQAGATYAQLGQQYGVAASTIGRRGRQEHWGRRGSGGCSDEVERCVAAVSSRLLQSVEDTLSGGESLSVKEIKELAALVRELAALQRSTEEASPEAPAGVHVVLEGPLEDWGG